MHRTQPHLFQLTVQIFPQMFAPDAKQAFPGAGLGKINGFAGALHQAQSGVVTHAENLSHFTGAVELVWNQRLELHTLALCGTQGRVNVLPCLD
jgi:hypothetical protein